MNMYDFLLLLVYLVAQVLVELILNLFRRRKKGKNKHKK